MGASDAAAPSPGAASSAPTLFDATTPAPGAPAPSDSDHVGAGLALPGTTSRKGRGKRRPYVI